MTINSNAKLSLTFVISKMVAVKSANGTVTAAQSSLDIQLVKFATNDKSQQVCEFGDELL